MDVISRLPYIYDIATSDRNWTTALDQLAEATGAKGAALYATNNTNTEFTITETNSFFHTRLELVDEYSKLYRGYDEWSVPFISRSKPFVWIPENRIWPELNLETGREDLDFLKEKFGIGRIGGINVSINRAWIAVAALQFDRAIRNPLLDADAETWVLSSHLAKAIEINRFYAQLRQRFRAVLTVLDNIDLALCIVLSSGEVITHNQRAQSVFDDRDGISLSRDNHLVLRDEAQASQLMAYVFECCRTAQGELSRCEGQIKASRKSLQDGYLIEVSPLRDGDDELNERFAGAMITIIDPSDPPKISVEGAAVLYNLTEAETSVSKHLIAGKTNPEIAEIRGVSAETVRNQVRGIHLKLDVRNRAELIRKVTSVSPPIAR